MPPNKKRGPGGNYRVIDYRCTGPNCPRPDRKFPRDELTVKRVQFTEMGENARVVRSRTVAWLCPYCLAQDEDYKRERTLSAPGFTKDETDGGS